MPRGRRRAMGWATRYPPDEDNGGRIAEERRDDEEGLTETELDEAAADAEDRYLNYLYGRDDDY